MKTAFLVLLTTALLAIPGAAAADTAASNCSVMDFNASQGELFGPPPPWAQAPDVGVPDPEYAKIAARVPLCPAFRPCSGSSCTETGTCAFTDTGKRCCTVTPGQQACCPAGKTVFQVNCACAGTSCNFPTHQTALCF